MRSGRSDRDVLFGPPLNQNDEGCVSDSSKSPLELEHVMGYTGTWRRTFLRVGLSTRFLKAMGSTVVMGDLRDPNEQKLLRGHDNEVCALVVSGDGALAASGQVASRRANGANSAAVVIWDLLTCSARCKVRGATGQVTALEFSPDAKLIACSDKYGLVYVWHCESGELVFATKQYCPKAVVLFEWLAVCNDGPRRFKYRVCVGRDGSADLDVGELKFEPARQQWVFLTAPVAMPTMGLIRDYRCSVVVDGFLLAGTAEGDIICVKSHSVDKPLDENRTGGVYRGSFPVCTGGVLAMAIDRESSSTVVYAGGGDGVLRRIIVDKNGGCSVEAELLIDQEGSIVALTIVHNEVLVGTSSAKTWRVLARDLDKVHKNRHLLVGGLAPGVPTNTSNKAVVLSAAHIAPPTDVSFSESRCEVFATCAADGEVAVWDLSEYARLASSKSAGRAKRASLGGGAGCLCWIGDASLAAGYRDGFVRCFAATNGGALWDIPNAHRQAVTALACRLSNQIAYLVSAAEDGSVCVWNLASRQLAMHFAEHRRAVTALALDVHDPNLFHTAGADSALLTYDLKIERRTVAQVAERGGASFTALSQRKDSEKEVITADANGTLCFWDCDIHDGPVARFATDPLLLDSCTPPTTNRRVQSLAVSPLDSAYLAVAFDETVAVFSLQRDNVRARPDLLAQGFAHSDQIRAVQWSPDQRQIVSVAEDACICIWNFYADEDLIADCAASAAPA